MPSSSARCSQLPRAVDKVPFYAALKKLRDYSRGDLKELDDSEVCFPDLELKVIKKEDRLKAEGYPDVDSKAGINLGNMPVPSTSQPMNGVGSPPGMNLPGSFMSIKQEGSYNSQDYGGVGGGMYPQQMPSMSLPCPSYPITSMAYSGAGNPIPHTSQGMVMLPGTTYPSQAGGSQLFGGQISQGSQYPTSHSSYIPPINCHGNMPQSQGQFLSPERSSQGQGSSVMYSPPGSAQNLPPPGVPNPMDLLGPLSFQPAGPCIGNGSMAMPGWMGMQNQSCGQSPPQPQQQGFDQMQNRVYIKSEPQEFGSSSACPFQNIR